MRALFQQRCTSSISGPACCRAMASVPAKPLNGLRVRRSVCMAAQSAEKDLRPYMLWDRVTQLTASWDTRGKADFKHICDTLQPRALEKITITQAEDADGQPRTCLTILCRPDDADDMAAALLQWTPATHLTVTPSEQCYLPVSTLTVTTPFGPIDVQLSLAGSTVRKVTPNWAQCQQLADQQQQQDAAAVAAAAVAALNAGLQDGSISIDAHLLF